MGLYRRAGFRLSVSLFAVERSGATVEEKGRKKDDFRNNYLLAGIQSNRGHFLADESIQMI